MKRLWSTPRKTRILVVDDYPENIRALSEIIRSDQVEIFTASNAEQALEWISKFEFGLILLDIHLPETSGLELAQIIRSVKKYRTLPIIFVTASQEDSSLVFQSYQSGAVDILFKPLNPNMVRAKVQMFVEMAEQKSMLERHVVELERLRIDAEAANIAKGQFLATMSHEIRTPLNAVLGFADLLVKSQPDNQETHVLASAIQKNGDLLLRLIDDILDLSKIEAGRMEIEKKVMDLTEVLNDVNTTLSFKAQEKNLEFIFVAPKNIDHYFISDPIRIKQVLINLIGNAIKFTSHGKVEAEMELDKNIINNTQTLKITVKDQGIGLSPEQQDRLFSPFGQGDSSTRREFGGSGLGLVISRLIARAMNGDVILKSSKIGKGSVFEAHLSLECTHRKTNDQPKPGLKEPTQPATAIPTDFSDKRILVVDDSPENLMLISMFLKKTQAMVVTVDNGPAALKAVKENPYDLILMDVQMPTMDGHETTAALRQWGFRAPIIACTAHAIQSEHKKCLDSGCNDVLTKPVSRTKLFELLGNYLT